VTGGNNYLYAVADTEVKVASAMRLDMAWKVEGLEHTNASMQKAFEWRRSGGIELLHVPMPR
jgi:hypothetical protein